MDCLINSSKDVNLLHHSGIIESWVGDGVEVYTMWHKPIKVTMRNANNFGYNEVFNNVDNHCMRRQCVDDKLKAELLQQSIGICFISCCGYTMLTMAQTVFSVLSYSKAKAAFKSLLFP
ncbi:unnamed protein product [Camellia sinensis]